jgi:hypothetical protein
LVGSYTSANFTVTSDGHGGTLITDPPLPDGGTVVTSATTSGSMADITPASAATVISGGYELGASGATAGDTDSGTDRGVFFSGGGMVQLDALLSQFAGIVSGFDLWHEIGVHSLGFGSSSSAMSWIQEVSGAPAVDKGGNTFNLTLLGQYAAANLNSTSDGHGGAMITDPPSSASVVSVPLMTHHS